MKPSRILLLHGWEGNPNLYWFPLAKKRFEREGYEVHAPEMPGGYFPKKDDWLKIVEDLNPDENWILIGHSLGGVTILKYLENATGKIAQAILIATPFEPMNFTPIANFFASPPSLRSGDSRREGGFDWSKIRNNCQSFFVLNEIDDSVVPLSHGNQLALALGVELHTVPGYSHFHSIDLDYLSKILVKSNK